MCGLFGFLRYGQKPIINIEKLTNALASASSVRGTDATGIAMNNHGRIQIIKEAKPAFKMNFTPHEKTSVLIGHTRHATQGDAKKAYNNHPFFGKAGKLKFALAHNGVLTNDTTLQRKYPFPNTKITTDSFVAVQLIEYQKRLSAESLKFMAEEIIGSFSFSLLDSEDSLWLVKGDSPLSILHFPSLQLYVYASTDEILWRALIETDLFEELKCGIFETVNIHNGDILHILSDGTIDYHSFHYTDYSFYHWDSIWPYPDTSTSSQSTSNAYLQDLKMIASYEGFSPEEIDELLANGFTYEEIEDYIYCS